VGNYLKIQQYRYSDILDYSINCDPELYSCLVPKIIIQPLVENAIYHGIKPKLDKGNISVTVYEQQEELMIEVKDDGIGMSDENLVNIRKNLKEHLSANNYGLYNVNRRIYLHFGENCGLTIDSKENMGVIAIIRLPKIMEEACSR